jgi:hypothetical protein
MKLNFMHILAHLGLVGVYPIYWNKKAKHDIEYTFSKYACMRLSRTKRKYNLDETPIKSRTIVVQIILKNQINTKLISKTYLITRS